MLSRLSGQPGQPADYSVHTREHPRLRSELLEVVDDIENIARGLLGQAPGATFRAGLCRAGARRRSGGIIVPVGIHYSREGPGQSDDGLQVGALSSESSRGNPLLSLSSPSLAVVEESRGSSGVNINPDPG